MWFSERPIRYSAGNRKEAGPDHGAPGAPWAVCMTPGTQEVLYSSHAFPGRIYKLNFGEKFLSCFGKSP
jgi:hypothetical protein